MLNVQHHRNGWFGIVVISAIALIGARSNIVRAQNYVDKRATPHMLHISAQTPGEVGTNALMRKAPLAGYFQPVEVRAPKETKISLAISNEFSNAIDGPVKAGLLIGKVYRLKVTGIPMNPGVEVYPTIELINRTYPPHGQEFQFPIPIELTQEELTFAMNGRFVTRVIYVEDPNAAIPYAIKEQPNFEVRPGEDPLTVADRLGRPIAILRIGGRLPDATNGPDATFMYNSPAMLIPHDVAQHLYPPAPVQPATLPQPMEMQTNINPKVDANGTPFYINTADFKTLPRAPAKVVKAAKIEPVIPEFRRRSSSDGNANATYIESTQIPTLQSKTPVSGTSR